MKALLHLKHWHIFMLTFGFRLLFALTPFVIYLTSRYLEAIDFTYLQVINIGIVVDAAGTFVFVLWCWVVGVSLAEKRPQDKWNAIVFKVALLLQVLGKVIPLVLSPFGYVRMFGLNPILAGLSFITFFYCDYVVAQKLTSVERGRETNFAEVIGDTLMLVFYPIGIWWLQPRINRIFNGGGSAVDPYAPLDQGVNPGS